VDPVDLLLPEHVSQMKEMEMFVEGEIFQSICIIPGPSIEVAKSSAFKTFFVDGAHMKDAQGESHHDSAQLLVVEAKTSLMEFDHATSSYRTKNLPLAVTLCLSESRDEYAFTYWTLARSGLDLNNKENNILHDRGKAVIAAREKALPLTDSFCCDQHLIRNVQALPGVGTLSDIARQAFLQMTKSLTTRGFETARTTLFSLLPANAVSYVMELDPSLINAFHFRQKTGKSMSFTNTNPVEAENLRLMKARWTTHPLETLIEVLKITGTTFAQHQKLIQRELEGLQETPVILPVVQMRALGPQKIAAASRMKCTLVDSVNKVTRVVTDLSRDEFVNVNLEERLCDCGRFAERSIRVFMQLQLPDI
jgi:hypothetical protein